jgi:hypothetical protein
MVEFDGLQNNLDRIRTCIKKRGFAVVRNVFPIGASHDVNVQNLIMKVVKDGSTIFQRIPPSAKETENEQQDNYNEEVEDDDPIDIGDGKRISATYKKSVQCPFVKAFTVGTANVMKTLFYEQDLRQSYASCLLSQEGCMEQELHYDYNTEIFSSSKSYVCIVFLQDGGTMRLRRGSKEINPSFSKGDILIFKGTKLHGGGAYQQQNIRIHYFFDCPDEEVREEDRTYVRDEFEPLLAKTTKEHYNIKHFVERQKRRREMKCTNLKHNKKTSKATIY